MAEPPAGEAARASPANPAQWHQHKQLGNSRRKSVRARTSQTRHRQSDVGLRLLRQAEIERLHGHTLLNRHFATALQMLGQGVQTRVFHSAFRQLAEHLGAATPTQFVD